VQLGINDAIEAMRVVGRAVDAGRSREDGLAESKKFVASTMKSYDALVDRLETLGAKRFLFLNLPDLGAAPFARQLKVVGLATGLSVQINQVIDGTIGRLRSNSGLRVASLDLFAKVKAVHAQPGLFGLASDLVIDRPCGSRLPPVSECTNPEKYFYYDLNHPTTPINTLVAQEAYSLLQ
jgi:phospholipase/lecithinase/hemolysin